VEKKKTPFPIKIFDDFSKREIIGFLEIVHHSVEAEGEEEIGHVLQLIKKAVPCEKVIAGLVRVDRQSKSHRFSKIINISYPSNWIHLYLKNNYSNVDPVLLSHISSFRTQSWANTYAALSSHSKNEFVEEARSFGLKNGVTTGAFEPGRGVGSFFSFAGDMPDDNKRYAGILEYLGHHLHQALMKTTAYPTHSYDYGNALSPRELSVLNWIKNGKTNWEISRILGVSERTVRFHVENIFAKLDVSSRTHAVALAVENGLLAVPYQHAVGSI
jgi:DNA-binding CsgD family transcriptional regulator